MLCAAFGCTWRPFSLLSFHISFHIYGLLHSKLLILK